MDIRINIVGTLFGWARETERETRREGDGWRRGEWGRKWKTR